MRPSQDIFVMFGGRGIVLIKKRKRTALFFRIFISFFVGFIAFLEIYGQSYSYLNQLSANDGFSYDIESGNISNDRNQYDVMFYERTEEYESLETKINKELQALEKENKSMEEVRDFINNKLQDAGTIYYDILDTKEYQEFYPYRAYSGEEFSEYVFSFNYYYLNCYGTVSVFPRFDGFLKKWVLFSLLVGVGIALLTFLAMSILWQWWNKKEDVFLAWLGKRKPFHSFPATLVIVNLLSLVLASILFLSLYHQRNHFFLLANTFLVKDIDVASVCDKIQEQVKGLRLDVANEKKINRILKEQIPHQSEVELYLYRQQDGVLYTISTWNVNLQIGNFLGIRTSATTTPILYHQMLHFDDQDGELVFYYYPLTTYVIPLIIFFLLSALLFYFMLVLSFIRLKVDELIVMKEEISRMAAGDLTHGWKTNGNDELAQLSYHINAMRLSLLSNMENERAARQANQELISSMSHDLRTPLTTLQGYLEIIQMEKVGVDKQKEYLQRAIRKMDEIKELSNRMFEYAQVYGLEEEWTKEVIVLLELNQMIQNHVDYLRLQGFLVNEMEERGPKNNAAILGSKVMMKRIFNNLFSNVQKYANLNQMVVVQSAVVKGKWEFHLHNSIKKITNPVEKNGIGLKSVQRMVSAHQGECYVTSDGEQFMVVITIALIDGDESRSIKK